MPSAYAKQIRITGNRAGILVYLAFDVAMSLHTEDPKWPGEKRKALARFNAKHPGARIIDMRLTKSKESDHAW